MHVCAIAFSVVFLLPVLTFAAHSDHEFINRGLVISVAGPGSVSDRKNDPCSLLQAGEVEAIMGPLAGPPFRAAGPTPQPKGEDCRYEAADRHAIRVNVMREGGAQLIRMMGAMQGTVNQAGLKELKLHDNTTVAGAWDDARISQCCEFNALHGDQLVTIDIAGSRATIAQAARLADAAVRRLDQPLEVDGTAGIKLAKERAVLRPKRKNVCDLLSRTDAEQIAGVSLLAPPKGDEESCTYAWALDNNGSRYAIELKVQWQDGFGAMRTIGAMVGNASSMIGLGKSSGQSKPAQDDGPWDEFSSSIIGVMAVKNDVLFSIESGPFKQDVARAFVYKAVVNLGK
jgi:hypothetical protein